MDSSSDIEFSPKVGMKFDSQDDAWKFWVEYGSRKGFGVRKNYHNKSRSTDIITSFRYVCCKQGVRRRCDLNSLPQNPRLETRTNCNVRMGVKLVDGKYEVTEFIEEHNHPLHLLDTVHMLSSQRNITEVQAYEIDLTEDVGLKQQSTFQLMCKQAGGRDAIGYTLLDAKNYLRSKRQRSMLYGEVGCLMRYFQQQLSKNPSFYHANQMDMEEQITNVFWADARMLIDYEYFGDVVSLDTTYCTNSAHRPFAIFSGFNHHRGAVIFGAALLYDETTTSFKWLFETFLEAHKQKKPLTVFTDQDRAMANALHEVMPETFHGLCTWHLMQNGIKHLGNLMKDESHFLTDFKRCMYGIDDEAQFEESWNILLAQYNVQDNTWLQSTYRIKEKWIVCYMKYAFTLGMRSTQLSESVNSDLKSCMKLDLNITQFFKYFEGVLEDKRYNELKCEFDARKKIPRLKLESSPMLRQLSKIYTLTVFDLFQKELDLFAVACIKYRNETQPLFEYIVGLEAKDGEWRVTFEPSTKKISCSCRKFEKMGLLCCHAIKVYDVMDIKNLPEHYMLKRWTREARSSIVHDYMGNEVEEDPKLQSSDRYRKLCMMLIRLATEASIHPSTFSLVYKNVCDLSKQVMEMCLTKESQDINKHVMTSSIEPSMTKSKGLKKKDGSKRSRRHKSWVELQGKQKKKKSKRKDIEAQNEGNVSCSAPPIPYQCFETNRSQFKFTELLMAPLDHPTHFLEAMELCGDASNPR